MAKSRKDPTRKENLDKYKESMKELVKQTNKLREMSTKVPESKPFQQVPTWDSSTIFELQGVELEALYNFFNIFAPAFTAIQQVFSRGVQSGKIKIGYQYADGSPVPSEEVAAYTAKLNEYFQQKQKEEAAKEAKSELAPTQQSKIVSFTSEPVTEDA